MSNYNRLIIPLPPRYGLSKIVSRKIPPFKKSRDPDIQFEPVEV